MNYEVVYDIYNLYQGKDEILRKKNLNKVIRKLCCFEVEKDAQTSYNYNIAKSFDLSGTERNETM